MDETLLFYREPLFSTQALMNKMDYGYQTLCGEIYWRHEWEEITDPPGRVLYVDDEEVTLCGHLDCNRGEIEVVIVYCGDAHCNDDVHIHELKPHNSISGVWVHHPRWAGYHVAPAYDIEDELNELLGKKGEW